MSVVGSDPFWAALKEGRRLRKEEDYAGSEKMFEKALKMANRAGVEAPVVHIEVARTWWHAGRIAEAVKHCEAMLPDIDAAKLIAAIFRERAKEQTKAGDVEQAMAAWRRVEDVAKRVDSRIMTPTDRKAVAALKKART